jgi:hypothetical protein
MLFEEAQLRDVSGCSSELPEGEIGDPVVRPSVLMG